MNKVSLLAFGLLAFGTANAQTPDAPTSSSYSSTTTTYGTAPTSNYNSTGTAANGSITTGTYSTNSYSSQANATSTAPDRANARPYKAVTVGVYAGVNSTRFKGENVDGNNLTGRAGYQAGIFVRGGGRVYGQIGAEYFASSSNYFKPGDGQTTKAITDQIDVKYIQIPALVGVKVLQSDRGISAIRLAVGVEYANRISSNSNQFNLTNSEIKSGSFNGLGNLGFDFGPVLVDLTYHYGFSNSHFGSYNSLIVSSN